MKKSYRDCLNRIACYADGATGLVEHEYKKVKTKTIVPVGGEYFIERDKTVIAGPFCPETAELFCLAAELICQSSRPILSNSRANLS